MSTLDATGLTVDRFPEIVDRIQTTQQAEISADLVYNDNTVIHQINSIVASMAADNAALVEAVYNAKRLSTATGVDLDYLGALKGIFRLNESRSNTSFQRFTGDAGALIPASSLFENPSTGDRFYNQDSIVLSSSECLTANITVLTLLDSTEYTVVVEGTTYAYTSDGSATNQEIVEGLRDVINADSGATYTASATATTLTIASDTNDTISIVVTTYLRVATVTIYGYLEAVNTGRIVAPPDTVTSIISTVAGLTSTSNDEQYILGRSTETDDEYRTRIAIGEGSPCLGTPPSIEAYLLANVAGIGSATVIENATSTVDGAGRPPHSYEVIVTGGTDADVAEAVWYSHGAGIELFGNTSEIYVDPRGRPHTVYFSRPTAINIAIRVTYTAYPEEVLPGNAEELMRTALVEYVNDLGGDVDVIVGRMFSVVYGAVDGLDDVTIETQTLTSPGDTPVGLDWDTARIEIDDNEFASTTGIDIYFVSA